MDAESIAWHRSVLPKQMAVDVATVDFGMRFTYDSFDSTVLTIPKLFVEFIDIVCALVKHGELSKDIPVWVKTPINYPFDTEYWEPPYCTLAYPKAGTYAISWKGATAGRLLVAYSKQSVECTVGFATDAAAARAVFTDLQREAAAIHAVRVPPVVHKPQPFTKIRTHLVRTERDHSMCWVDGPSRHVRSLDTLYLPDTTKKGLIQELQEFANDYGDYVEHGLPYKRVILLSGKPGTGKTSSVWVAASHFQKDVALLTATPHMTNEHLALLLRSIPSSAAYLLIEEVDCLFEGRVATKAAGGITFSQLLTMLDGLNTPHGIVIFLTTNDRNKLTDEAFGRACRIDSEYTFDYMEKPEIEAAVASLAKTTPVEQRAAFVDAVVKFKFAVATLQEYVFRRRKQPGALLRDVGEFETLVAKYHTAPQQPKYKTQAVLRGSIDS